MRKIISISAASVFFLAPFAWPQGPSVAAGSQGVVVSGKPAATAAVAPEQRTRPDALAYSASIWPPGSIMTNQEVSSKTKYGVMTCRGGWSGRTNQLLGRVCSSR